VARRARRGAALTLAVFLLVLLVSVAILPGLSGLRGASARALSGAGAALSIPASASPSPAPALTPDQLASRAGSLTTAARLAEAEKALDEGRTQDALAAYTAAVEAIVPVLADDDRGALSDRAQKVYDTLFSIFDAAEPVA